MKKMIILGLTLIALGLLISDVKIHILAIVAGLALMLSGLLYAYVCYLSRRPLDEENERFVNDAFNN